MTLLQNNLWCKILWSTTEGQCDFIFSNKLSQSEISYFCITLIIKQQIFQLKISVDEVLVMEMSKSQGDTSCVELSLFLFESLLLTQMLEEFTSLHKLHHKVKFLRRLESIIQVD